MRVAVIDLGSNSVRSLAVDVDGDVLRLVDATSTITRFTEGIGEGAFSPRPEALDRTLAVLRGLKTRLDGLGVSGEGRSFFATESLRALSSAGAIVPVLEGAAEAVLQVLPGEEEARLSCEGVRLGGIEAEAVFDLGGGSLEIVADGALSLPLGAVRLTDLFGGNRRGMALHVLAALKASGLSRAASLAGVGGTSSALAMMVRSLPKELYRPDGLHGTLLSRWQVRLMARDLAAMTAERRRAVVGLDPKRADIIVAGLTVIETLMAHLGLEAYRHSECDLLWGMARRRALALGFSPSSVRL
ncbi:phosphatase [Aminithiophilus ramosus]|uniref:Phosphatase n=1 Tax=Aminithiophilus ramosus TaxID=3029084 RepID=A0A9Q7A5V0_9BACT|nr:phosphatase [Aminithiophilus ramosus]QTX31635.1 phosphatase [Aminithiophilus ramosus]